MKDKISSKLQIPEGISCELKGKVITCKKGSVSFSRELELPKISVSLSGNEIIFSCEATSKRELKLINSNIAHMKNVFVGLEKEFTYVLEAVNVHFPMTLKVDKGLLLINNFLGEKKPRIAKIHPNVKAEVKGQKITLTSHDKDAAGQTVSNIERATKVKNRDRRVFQDGIYLVERPGRL